MSGGDEPSPPSPGDRTATGAYAADLAPGTILANRFRLDGLLGIGGMGVVYRATDLDLGIAVAVKLLRAEVAARPGAFERFRQELLLSRQVSSPHVLRIHDIARHGERWLISMDLVDGEPLDRWLDARGPLPVDEALGLARQLALGLAAAHARGVVHRDLKPANVLVDANGHASIGDFGIARSLGTSGLTGTGTVVGTPDYLSPEQARAQPVDARSDLYALGLLLYEMLAGQPAFHGSTASESLARRMVGPPPSIGSVRKDVPPWVQRLLERLLRSSPSHRLPSAEAVVRAIDAREVPRDLRPGARAWLALGGAVAIGAGLWFGLHRPVGGDAAHTGAVAAPSVPDRVVLLPIEDGSGDAPVEATLSGAAELLRQRLAADDRLTVVDGARVDQAVAQLRAPDGGVAAIDATALRALLPARDLLRPRLDHGTRGWIYRAQWLHADGRRQAIATPPAQDLAQATRAFGRALHDTLSAGAGPATGAAPVATSDQPDEQALFPATEGDLDAYGHALELQRAGRMEDATAAFDALTARLPRLAPAWLAQAQVAFASGRPDAAAQAAEHGLALPAGAGLRRAFGHWQALAGGVDPARALAAEAARTRARPDDLDAHLRLAQLKGQANQVPAAIATLRALVARDPNDPRTWFLLGKDAILHGDLREAVDDDLVRALVQYKRGRNPFGEAETVNALGVAYSRLGQSADAREQFGKAVALRRALGDRRGVASSLRNLAQLATVQGDFAQAQAQLDEARALFSAIGDAGGLDAVDNELGLLAEERGDYAAADGAFRRMLRARERDADAAGVAESLNNVGFAQFALGAYDDANAYWQQALAAFAALDDVAGRVQVQQNLGALEIARGHWPAARRLLDDSIAIAEKRQMVEETAVSRFHLAQLALLEGRLGDAAAELDRAGRLFAERDDKRGQIEVALLRGQWQLAANALPDATRQLATLATLMPSASAEQRAALALLRGDLAERRGDAAAARAARTDAQRQADASGVRAIRLRARIALRAGAADAPGDAALEADLRDLGHYPLQLAWAERRLRRDLGAGRGAAALDDYASALALLRDHERTPSAVVLHTLGAEAARRAGKPAEAQAAATLAASLARNIAATLPEAQRAGYLAGAGARGDTAVALTPARGADKAVADGR